MKPLNDNALIGTMYGKSSRKLGKGPFTSRARRSFYYRWPELPIREFYDGKFGGSIDSKTGMCLDDEEMGF